MQVNQQWWIQDFPEKGTPTTKVVGQFSPKMKMKKLGPEGGGGAPGGPHGSGNDHRFDSLCLVDLQKILTSILPY